MNPNQNALQTSLNERQELKAQKTHKEIYQNKTGGENHEGKGLHTETRQREEQKDTAGNKNTFPKPETGTITVILSSWSLTLIIHYCK